jgi:hypothetical protein
MGFSVAPLSPLARPRPRRSPNYQIPNGPRCPPRAKIADEIRRWKQTVLTTFSVHCDPRYLERIAGLVRS